MDDSFCPNPPAATESLEALLRDTSASPLPDEYIAFLRRVNGGEGFLGENYAVLWRAEELVQFNREYETVEYAPQLFLIGSNGGGEAYAFDQTSGSSTLFFVPFIGMAYREIMKIADSFSVFVAAI